MAGSNPPTGQFYNENNVQLFELNKRLLKELEEKDLKIQELTKMEDERNTMQKKYEADLNEKDFAIRRMIKDRIEIQKCYEEAVLSLKDVTEKNVRWSEQAEQMVREEGNRWKELCEQKEDKCKAANDKLNIAERKIKFLRGENQSYKARIKALEKLEVEGKDVQSRSRTSHITCKICEFVYTEAPERTPRMLGCGHTVCESCAEKLSEHHEAENRRVVKCPFDRRATLLNDGTVQSLPKNFAITDDIETYNNRRDLLVNSFKNFVVSD